MENGLLDEGVANKLSKKKKIFFFIFHFSFSVLSSFNINISKKHLTKAIREGGLKLTIELSEMIEL